MNDANYKLLEQYEKRKRKLESDITVLYNKKLEEIISVDSFKEQYSKLKIEMKEVESKIVQLKQICNVDNLDEKLQKVIIDFKNGKELTNDIMQMLIKRIEVYEDMKIDIEYNV